MYLIPIGQAARKLCVDPDKMRRHIVRDRTGQEFLELNGLRLKVYYKGLVHRNRFFDADEIAYKLIQSARLRRLGAE